MRELFKLIFWFLAVPFTLLCADAMAACDTSISRTNNSANAVLTSTKYNLDLNTVYTRVNEFPGDCITDGTLDFEALDATGFSSVLNGIHQGCKVEYSSASAVTVDRCILSIGGNNVRTTVATTLSMACTGCSSEAASTVYYVYAKADSTGSTLNLLFLTGAPNDDGYDGSGNKVLGKLWNSNASDIDTYSIDQWNINQFIPQITGNVSAGVTVVTGTTTDPTKGGVTIDRHEWQRYGQFIVGRMILSVTNAGTYGSGDYLWQLPTGLRMDSAEVDFDTTLESSGPWTAESTIGHCHYSTPSAEGFTGVTVPYDATNVRMFITSKGLDNAVSSAATNGGGFGFAAAANWSIDYRVAIEGWGP